MLYTLYVWCYLLVLSRARCTSVMYSLDVVSVYHPRMSIGISVLHSYVYSPVRGAKEAL